VCARGLVITVTALTDFGLQNWCRVVLRYAAVHGPDVAVPEAEEWPIR